MSYIRHLDLPSSLNSNLRIHSMNNKLLQWSSLIMTCSMYSNDKLSYKSYSTIYIGVIRYVLNIWMFYLWSRQKERRQRGEKVYHIIFSSTGETSRAIAITLFPSVRLSVRLSFTHFTQKVLIGSSPMEPGHELYQTFVQFLTSSSKMAATAAILIFWWRLLLQNHKW